MKRFVVVQHTYSEFLGLIESQLEKRDIGFHYFRPFVGQQLLGSAAQYDALFLLGAAQPPTARKAYPWIDDELALIGVFREAKRPVVGFGFGALLIAEYEGAQVSGEPFHQAYWTVARKTEAGKGDPLAEAVDGRCVLVLYNGSASLPATIAPILVGEKGEWLAIRPEPLTYGMLFRPELKPGMLEDMVMEAKRITPPNIGELLQQARAEWQGMQALTDQVVVALVKALDLMQERRKPPVFHVNVTTDQ